MAKAKREWWHDPKAQRIVLEIEDDSDCPTCTKRHSDNWQMLQDVRCDALPDVICPECGRTVTILTPAS